MNSSYSRDGVPAVHHLEHAVRARLRRDVEVAAEARALSDDAQHVVAEVARVARNEAEPLDRGDLVVDPLQQIREGRHALARERVAAVRSLERAPLLRLGYAVDRHGGAVLETVVVHRLAEQRDLDDTRVRETLALVDDVVRRAVDLGPAR